MLAVLGRVVAGAAGCAAAPVWSLADADLLAALDGVQAAEAALAAARAHLVREVRGRDLAGRWGASSLTVLLRDRLRISAPAARRLIEVADGLDRLPALDAAVSAGA